MKSKIKHNWGLKLAAVLCAAVLWMISTDINDPIDEKRIFGVKVQVVNTGSLTSQGMTYNVLNNTDNVAITVQAKTSVLNQIADDDISLRADMSKITDENTIPIEWNVDDSIDNLVESVSLNKDYVYLSIEQVNKKQLRIEVVENGKLPDGYVTGSITTETNTMSISGPASAVEPVSRAVVDINLDNATNNINMEAVIRLLDEDGKEVSNSEITKSIDSVIVNVPVLMTKEVPIVFESMGTPAEGYAATGDITPSQTTVMIAGKENALNNVTEIRVPASELNVDDAKESVVENVDIRKYLPSDISLANRTESGVVSVTVGVEAIRNRVISFGGSDIQLLNNPDTQRWLVEAIPDQSLRLRLSGLQRNLDNVDLSVVVPHVDLSVLTDADGNLVPGETEANVLFLIPEDVIQEETVKVKLRITQIMQTAVEE